MTNKDIPCWQDFVGKKVLVTTRAGEWVFIVQRIAYFGERYWFCSQDEYIKCSEIVHIRLEPMSIPACNKIQKESLPASTNTGSSGIGKLFDFHLGEEGTHTGNRHFSPENGV